MGRGSVAFLAGALLLLAASAGGPAGAAEPRTLTLEEGLRLAAERNLRLRSARQEAAELAQELPKAYTEFLPKLHGEARYFLQSPRPIFVSPAGSSPVPPIPPVLPDGLLLPERNVEIPAGQRTDYTLRLRLEQPLFTGFRLTSAYAAARLGEQIGVTRVTRAEREVAEQVKVAFFETLKAQEHLAAAEARVRLREAEIRHTEGLVAGGRATPKDLAPLRAALAVARQEAFEASQRVEVALHDLKRLVGLDPAEAVRPERAPEERLLALELEQATRMGQDEREQPDLRELALAAERSREGITQARSKYYPRVGLFGTIEKQRETLFNPRGDVLAGGVEATWTLWEWNRIGHEVAQARLRHERALTDLRFRRDAIAQEVRVAFGEVRIAERLVDAFREEVEAARVTLQVAEERLRTGVGVARDVTVARSELARALARYRAAVYDTPVARARLERIVGAAELPTVPGNPTLALDVRADLDVRGLAPAAPEGERAPTAPAVPPRPRKDDAAAGPPQVPEPPPKAEAPPVAEGAPSATPMAGRRGFEVAVATVRTIDEARRLAARLDARGFGPVRVDRRGTAFRLVLTGFSSRETAQRAARDARRELARPPDVPPGTSPGRGAAGAPSERRAARFALQVASFQDADRALALARTLETQRFGTPVVVAASAGSGQWHRVVLNGFPTRESARRAARDLQARFAVSPVLLALAAGERPASP